MNIVGFSGSPTGGSSTEILLLAALESAGKSGKKTRLIRLNEQRILPCQSCGKSPEPEYCFFHDDMDQDYRLMEKSDGIILASPIFFDSVSAQAKLFIDRTNCIRPPDFSDIENPKFKKPLFDGKKGGIIIVGGEREEFDSTFRTARGFFIWAGIEIIFEMKYASKTFAAGEAGMNEAAMSEARQCGKKLAEAIG